MPCNLSYIKDTNDFLKKLKDLIIIKVGLVVGLDDKFVSFIEETKTFQNNEKSELFDIRKGTLNYSINLVVYLTECKSCSKQYMGSIITPFCNCFNNYKSGARNV